MSDLIETVARRVSGYAYGMEDGWKNCTPHATDILRAIEADGYRIVPVEPTEDMLRDSTLVALSSTVGGEGGWQNYMGHIWATMLAAAPKVVP